MTGWVFAGILATACGFLLYERIVALRMLREVKAELTSQYEAKLEFLRREKDMLLHTALEAKGVAVVDPSQPAARNVEVIGRRTVRERVNAGLDRLAAEDRKNADRRAQSLRDHVEELRKQAAALGPESPVPPLAGDPGLVS